MKNWILISWLAMYVFSPLTYGADPSTSNVQDSSNSPEVQIEQIMESVPIPPALLEDLRLKTENSKTGSEDPYYRSQVVMKLPGKIVASGSNTKPVGDLKLKTYRLEEITLPEPWEVKIGDQDQLVTRAWRLTIFGGPFPVRNMAAEVWIDNKFIAYGDNTDKGLVAVVYDSSVFINGAEIAISYGDNGIKSKLPERLFYKGLL
ncbi:MAG: hypothetical protein WCS87_02945 [Methylococcaceae bacterium]